MGWSTLFFIVGILFGVIGIWNLARQRNIFLALAGILWFLVVLFERYIPRVYNYQLGEGVPALGLLFLYLVIPIFLIIAFFSAPNRR
jgi:tetrahydromethanopterin S-methyltransferase subunit C